MTNATALAATDLRVRWCATLAPVIGRASAVALMDLIEECVPLAQRARFVEHLVFAESLGDPDEVRRLIMTKAARTLRILLSESDTGFEQLMNAAPDCGASRLSYGRLAAMAAKLRDAVTTQEERPQ